MVAETLDTAWEEGHSRYGCAAHQVEPMIYFIDGKKMTAKEYERAN
jgi:hypothetical protein